MNPFSATNFWHGHRTRKPTHLAKLSRRTTQNCDTIYNARYLLNTRHSSRDSCDTTQSFRNSHSTVQSSLNTYGTSQVPRIRHNVKQSSRIPYDTTQSSRIPYDTMQSSRISYDTLQSSSIPHDTTQSSRISQDTTQSSRIPHDTTQSSRISHDTRQSSRISHDTRQSSRIPHNTTQSSRIPHDALRSSRISCHTRQSSKIADNTTRNSQILHDTIRTFPDVHSVETVNEGCAQKPARQLMTKIILPPIGNSRQMARANRNTNARSSTSKSDDSDEQEQQDTLDEEEGLVDFVSMVSGVDTYKLMAEELRYERKSLVVRADDEGEPSHNDVADFVQLVCLYGIHQLLIEGELDKLRCSRTSESEAISLSRPSIYETIHSNIFSSSSLLSQIFNDLKESGSSVSSISRLLSRWYPFKPYINPLSYQPYPELKCLPDFPRTKLPHKYGVPVYPPESRKVMYGYTCTPAPKYRAEKLMTNAHSKLAKYYNSYTHDDCMGESGWIKVPAKYEGARIPRKHPRVKAFFSPLDVSLKAEGDTTVLKT